MFLLYIKQNFFLTKNFTNYEARKTSHLGTLYIKQNFFLTKNFTNYEARKTSHLGTG